MQIGDKIDVIGFGRWNKARASSKGHRGLEMLQGTVLRIWSNKVSVQVGAMTLIFRGGDGHEINFNGRRISGFRMVNLITEERNCEDSIGMAQRDGSGSSPAGCSAPDENRGEIG